MRADQVTHTKGITLRHHLVSDCRFGVSPVNYPDPETILITSLWLMLSKIQSSH